MFRPRSAGGAQCSSGASFELNRIAGGHYVGWAVEQVFGH
jgi:hypothetical protein